MVYSFLFVKFKSATCHPSLHVASDRQDSTTSVTKSIKHLHSSLLIQWPHFLLLYSSATSHPSLLAAKTPQQVSQNTSSTFTLLFLSDGPISYFCTPEQPTRRLLVQVTTLKHNAKYGTKSGLHSYTKHLCDPAPLAVQLSQLPLVEGARRLSKKVHTCRRGNTYRRMH
jgi:hypothetical protein